LGEELQRTNAASAAIGKGRHTTTSAKLLKHPWAICLWSPRGSGNCSFGVRRIPWRRASLM
jgi:hypothetical protein